MTPNSAPVTISTQAALCYAVIAPIDGDRFSSHDAYATFFRIAVLAALPVLLLAGAALAQERRRRLPRQSVQPRRKLAAGPGRRAGTAAQAVAGDPAELTVRLDRMESALRQLTGTIEQLQYRNQQLEKQLERMQDDTDYRLQQLGAKGGAAPAAPVNAPPAARPAAAATCSIRRSSRTRPARRARSARSGGRGAGAIPANEAAGRRARRPRGRRSARSHALSGNPSPPPPVVVDDAGSGRVAGGSQPVPQLPPAWRRAQCRRARRPQLATLPPSASPQDEYDLAYGYVLHKDYALAEQTFRDFLRKYPNERLVPDAQYWLGESLFQRQRYRDAAESFLAVSTKYEKSGKAPDSLLRLGQSLAALNQKEAACATLAEVGRKYPRASASVKRGVDAGTEACPLLKGMTPKSGNRFSDKIMPTQKPTRSRRGSQIAFLRSAIFSGVAAGRLRRTGFDRAAWCSPRAGAMR